MTGLVIVEMNRYLETIRGPLQVAIDELERNGNASRLDHRFYMPDQVDVIWSADYFGPRTRQHYSPESGTRYWVEQSWQHMVSGVRSDGSHRVGKGNGLWLYLQAIRDRLDRWSVEREQSERVKGGAE